VNIRLSIRKSITGLRILLEKLGKIIYQSEYEKNRDKWYFDGSDETKRVEFIGLDSDSVVFDAGGWRGDWASDIYSRYKPMIHVFEPVPEYADFILKRFKMNSQVTVREYGLGGKDQKIPIYIGNEGSSLFINNNTTDVAKKIEIRDVYDYFVNNNVTCVDLFKINIEGGEYDLLDRVIEKNLQFSIDRFLIQFHDFVANADTRRSAIRRKLAESHELLFDYPYVWECWVRKSGVV
jgi:FkbM family methyltransferase